MDLPSIITHTMNVFGERQNPEKYIPMVIKKVRDNEVVTVHANPEKTIAGSRHYIHAEDVADALIFLFNYDFSLLLRIILELNVKNLTLLEKMKLIIYHWHNLLQKSKIKNLIMKWLIFILKDQDTI